MALPIHVAFQQSATHTKAKMRDGRAISREAFSGMTGVRTSDFRLGLALVLLKSKPPTVTLRDYVDSLRRHIKEGSQEDAATSRHLHLDSLQFWKEQYDSLKSSEMELRKKVFVLEKQLLTERTARSLGGSVRHPHKGQRDGGAKAVSQPGQSSQNNAITWTQPGLADMQDFGTAFNASSPATGMVPLICQVSHLRRLMGLSNCNIQDLSATSACVSSSIAKVLFSVCAITQERKDTATSCRTRGTSRARSLPQDIEDREVGDIFRGVFKIFNYLLKVLNIICSSDATAPQGRIIYNLVRLFVDVMDCLSIMSAFGAPMKKGPTRSAPRKAKGQEAVAHYPATSHTENIQLRLSQLLINMMTVLDPTQKGHAELYEGFQFVLFTRIGQRLSFFVFGEEFPNSSLDELRMDSLKGGNCPDEQDAASRQVEARYLIWLMERVVVDLYDSNPAYKLTGQGTKASGGGDTQSLLREAKSRIRSTLLKGVFGEDAEEFDGLQMPTLPDGSHYRSVDSTREELSGRLCTPELFVRETWRLVGWQILAGDDLL